MTRPKHKTNDDLLDLLSNVCVFRRFRPLVPKEGALFFRRKAPYDSEGFRHPIPIDCAWVFRANRSVATRVFQLFSVL